MATQLYRVPTNNNLQYTLASSMAQGASSCTLNSDPTGVVRTPGVFVIDRVDASGNLTPTLREYISFTGQASTTLSGLVKGLGGSTDVSHAAGAIVEFVPDVIWADALYTVITKEHDVYGSHISLPSVYTETAQQMTITNTLIASGASLQGFPIRPTWVLPGSQLGNSIAAGMPVKMDRAGTIQYISAIAGGAASGVSLYLDLAKNNTTVFGAYKLTIPLNGTYVSIASLSTATFSSGDVFTILLSTPSSYAQDVTIQMLAR